VIGISENNLLKHPFIRKLRMPVLALLLLSLILSMIFDKSSGLLHFWELRRERDRLVAEIESLKNEKSQLEIQIELLKQRDPKIIEHEARLLGMIRDDEEVFRLNYVTLPDSVVR